MNPTPASLEIYLDANFLVAYFLSKHADSKKAQKMFARLLIGNNKMLLSPLVVDEVMNGIYKTLRDQERVNGLLPDKSHKDYINNIRQAVEQLTKDTSFNIIQFRSDPADGCLRAVENIDRYDFRPRDGFHLAYMQDQEIEYIVTNDRKFDGVKTINRVSF